MTVGIPSLSMRSYLSTHHLWMAEHCARLARDYEYQHRSSRASFHIHLRGYVLACITESVAFVEALINELFTDVHEGYSESKSIKFLDEDVLSRMKGYWGLTNSGRSVDILTKFDMARLLRGIALLDKGTEPFQSMKLLIALRNWQVHYYPSSVSEDSPHTLQAKLENRFEPNALIAGSGNAWFPDKALGAGCAKWAVATARAFADDFVGAFAYEPNYRKVALLLDPP
jgi:hypothetical protein